MPDALRTSFAKAAEAAVDQATKDRIRQDVAVAKPSQSRGRPSFFLDGKKPPAGTEAGRTIGDVI